MRKLLIRAGLTLLALLAASELAHAVAAQLFTADDVRGDCSVLVLGYPTNDDGTPSAIDVQRMDAAARAMHDHQCAQMIVSGGAAHNAFVEADVMASLAPGLGVTQGQLVLERHAHDTKENIALSLPSIPQGTNVLIVSNAVHAQRGRRYLCAARPADCSRTFAVATRHAWFGVLQRFVESLHEMVSFARDSFS